MSKNFELLQRVAQDEYLRVPESPARTANQARPAIPFKKEPPDAEIANMVQRLFSASGKPRIYTIERADMRVVERSRNALLRLYRH